METNEHDDSPAGRMLALNEVLLHQYLKGLADANPRIRRKAAHRLAGLGKAAERALPQLEVLLLDPDRHVRDAAALTVKRITVGE